MNVKGKDATLKRFSNAFLRIRGATHTTKDVIVFKENALSK
jgi:hypothetical protein